MAISDKTTIKNRFKTGDKPTQSDFEDFIDSSLGVVQEDTKLNIRAHNEGGTVSGNARGANSVDLQTVRSNATFVAAGANSVIIGGENNGITSTGTHSAIVGGLMNYNCSGVNCLISGRENVDNSGAYCNISGYDNHSNSGKYCIVSGGGYYRGNHSNSGDYCNISGANNYSNSGHYCNISGGSHHTNSGFFCNISGFNNHSNSGDYCNISGLNNYTNLGNYCSISGSSNSSNSGAYCSISGSNNYKNSGNYCSISGQYNYGNFGNNSIIGGQVAFESTKIAASGTSASESTDLITKASHGCDIGMAIKFTTLTGGTGLSTATQYYVIANGLTASTFKVSETRGGTAVDITGDYTVANFIANAVNYGNFNLISGEDNEGGTGSWCSISGDQNYNNSGSYCNISGTQNHSNSGDYCSISGFYSNGNSGNYCSISGRDNYLNEGDHCSISGRYNVSNTGDYCSISGHYAVNNALSYARVHGGNTNARIIDLVAKKQTTNNTPTALTLGGGTEEATTAIVIPNDTTWGFTISVVARRTDGDNESAFYKFEGCIDNNANTVALVGSVIKNIVAEDTAAWDIDVTADDTLKALRIVVTGENAKTINWTARVDITQADG